MIQHYLKVSVRDLMRYKTQNLIALCGVALSLLCFSICLVRTTASSTKIALYN